MKSFSLNIFFSALLFKVASVVIVFNAGDAQAQNFGDRSFYLVDSINLNEISEDDRILLDTTLQIYHASSNDTFKLDLIEHIVDQCWNEEVWPRYNKFLYYQAYEKFQHSYSLPEQKKYASLLAGAVSNMGYICDNLGNVPGALIYYHQALKIYERIGDFDGCASGFNNLGVLYSSQGDTAKAMHYHSESLRLKKMIGDEQGMALSLNNVGTLLKDQGRYFEALTYFEKSLRITKKLGDERVMAISYDNIAGVYFAEGYPTKAIEYYQKAYTIRKTNGEYSGAAFSLNNIASVYLSLKNYSEAEEYASQSLVLAEEIAYPMDIMNAAGTLYEIHKVKKNFERSLYFHELHIRMRDSLHNLENERATLSQSLKYQYEKEALKDSLNNQKIQTQKDSIITKQNAENEKERILRYALVIVILLMLYVVYISIRNYRVKQRDNELISLQKQEVERQKLKIEKQHHILEETFKEISDSITYAKRIQQAILPPVGAIQSEFSDAFVWYLPKQVVSGDFYWKESILDITILAVADCTGHGVPGAMVSVVCHNSLNRAVLEFGLTEPAAILDKTRELVIETFDKSGTEVKDGMDICLVAVHKKKNQLIYAGANNNLYLIRPKLFTDATIPGTEVSLHDQHQCTLLEFKADKQPIGRFARSKPFGQKIIDFEPGDQFYLFTDGLADQFGGPKGKKFKYQQIKEILVSNHTSSLESQMESIRFAFEKWKGELEQVDDICLVGFKL